MYYLPRRATGWIKLPDGCPSKRQLLYTGHSRAAVKKSKKEKAALSERPFQPNHVAFTDS
jgi:hypothetical protein